MEVECSALNTLGFLHYHGIRVAKSRYIAFEYFHTAALKNDKQANFVCYCMEEKIKNKFKYMAKAIADDCSKSQASLGVLIY